MDTQPIKTSKMLFGKQAVLDYMTLGETAVLRLVNQGLPIRIDGGRWFAYVDNIELWMQRWTFVSYAGKGLPEDSE